VVTKRNSSENSTPGSTGRQLVPDSRDLDISMCSRYLLMILQISQAVAKLRHVKWQSFPVVRRVLLHCVSASEHTKIQPRGRSGQ
jgi:hypothetical protein